MNGKVGAIAKKLSISRNNAKFVLLLAPTILLVPPIITFITFCFVKQNQLSYIKSYFDVLYDTSGMFLIMIASLALVAAIVQSRETSKTRRATVIIDLETRWSSKELKESRVKYQELVNNAWDIENLPQDKKDQFYQAVKSSNHKDYIYRQINDSLVQMRNSPDAAEKLRYHDIMEMAAFFEYIGVLVERRYLSIIDVDSLFGPSSISYYENIAVHIAEVRQLDVAPNKVAYQNFSNLVADLKTPPLLRVWD